jgi:hypothetical protein
MKKNKMSVQDVATLAETNKNMIHRLRYGKFPIAIKVVALIEKITNGQVTLSDWAMDYDRRKLQNDTKDMDEEE